MSTSTQHVFEVTALPTSAVTVYADRAEVKRLLKTTLKTGANEVIVKKLTRSIDKESIRVEGRGNATIAEVLYQEKHVKKEDQVREEQKEMTEKLERLREDRKKYHQEEQRLRKQRQLLDGVAERIGRPGSGESKPTDRPTNGSSLIEITDAHLTGLDKFFDYFVSRSSKLDEQIIQVEKKGRDMDEEIRVLENNLNESKYGGIQETYLSREVSILLDAQDAGAIELDISYIVWNASWKPSYDLRVYTADRDLKVFYYGLVEQNTGEAWNDVKLSLSTATPSVGGQIPELGTLRVGFHRPPPPPQMYAMAEGMVGESAEEDEECVTERRRSKMKRAASIAISKTMDFATTALRRKGAEPSYLPIQAVEIQESVISTSFEIARPTTIPSDNASHKVTVALIDLKPDFEYETVPAKSPLAYLKARVRNTSQFPLLRGPTSVFLDNNFVAKSQLKAVSPQEEFTCSLGVDPAIRIEYKPPRKFHEETGLLSKSSVITHEQKINIKNTRSDAIKITVVDHLPLSSEEKVKVHLIDPPVRENSKTVRVNKHNNVEWELQVNASESKELVLKYQVDHPKGEQLEFKEDEA